VFLFCVVLYPALLSVGVLDDCAFGALYFQLTRNKLNVQFRELLQVVGSKGRRNGQY
jgi:hypothetical protein